jgi:hypothetical protein
VDAVVQQVLMLAIGGLLSLAGVCLSNVLQHRRERAHWERQQAAERVKTQRERHEKEYQRLQEIYGECLYHLGRITNPRQEGSSPDSIGESYKLVRSHTEDASKWLMHLLVALPAEDPSLETNVMRFFNENEPDKVTIAKVLRNQILKRAKSHAGSTMPSGQGGSPS